MITDLQTTSLIILWTLVLSLLWAMAMFEWAARRAPGVLPRAKMNLTVLPALVLAPLALVVGFRLLGVNLLFPVHLFADQSALLKASLVPALILMMASGLGVRLGRAVSFEYRYWRQKPFSQVAVSYGLEPEHMLRRLVVSKAMAESWAQCLPWIFGEIIIVEVVFNAPGVGLSAWHAAKTRDFVQIWYDIVQLGVLYIGAAYVARSMNAWIGRRLETYA